MADDWRVTMTLEDEGHSARILDTLRDREVRSELRDALGERVAVSGEGRSVFLYASTRRAAEAGEQALREAIEEHGLGGTPKLERWHPVEERWEDPSVELSPEVERERREADETSESLRTGIAQWEVRVELDSAKQAESAAADLEADGYSVERRHGYLLVGANSEEDAKALAERLATVGRVHVGPSTGVAWQLLPTNPFAIFGGLGA